MFTKNWIQRLLINHLEFTPLEVNMMIIPVTQICKSSLISGASTPEKRRFSC